MAKNIVTVCNPSTSDPYPVYVLRPATNTAGYIPTWDGANSGKLADGVATTSFLLATGTTVGASSQAQAFTNGVKTGKVFPAADGTTAVGIYKADASTAVVNIDTTNSRVMIGNVSGVPTVPLVIRAAAGSNPFIYINDGDISLPNWSGVGFAPAPDAETVARIGVLDGGKGGFAFQGFCVSNASSVAIDIAGWHGSNAPTGPCITFRGWKHNGATSYSALAASEIVCQVLNATTTLATVLGGGNVGIGTVTPGTLLDLNRADAATNTVTNSLTIRHASSGTPAAGFGAGLIFGLESSTTENQSAARICAVTSEATHATRKYQLVFSAYDTAEREGLRIGANGSAPTIGVLGATPAARMAHIADAVTTHNITDPADAPADADALREDLVTNVLPDIEGKLNALGTIINSILTVPETFGYTATS